MENFDTARNALETSLNSAGSAMAEHEKWQQSLEAQLLSLKASWQGLSQAFLSSDFLKVALDGVINLVDGLTKLIDKFGALPTLIGAFAGGMSLFKNEGIFKFDKDAESISVFGQAYSELGKNYEAVSTKINKYNSLNAQHQIQFCDSMKTSNTSFAKYISGLNGGKASMGGYITSLVGAKVATFALQAATITLNAALTMGVSALISWGISALDKWIVTADELAEKVDDVTSKYKEQHKTLIDMKGDYDTSNEDSLISRYAELSKGVDGFGRNLSLTADEYSEYQNVVSTIANQMPSLVSGYDSQGNAILSCAGNVSQLTAEYEKLIKAQNDEVLINSSEDINKDFKNVVKDAEQDTAGIFGWNWTKKLGFGDSKLSIHSAEMYENILKSTDAINEFNKAINTEGNSLETFLDSSDVDAMSELLESAGFEKEGDFWNGKESNSDHIRRALEEDKSKVKDIVDQYYSDLEAETEGKKAQAQAALSNALDLSDSIYHGMDDTMKNIAQQTVAGFDFKFFAGLDKKGVSVEEYINNMLSSLNSLSKNDSAAIETAFNLKTQFNDGDISYGEYIDGLENTGNLVDDLISNGKLDEEVGTQIKLSIGLNEDGVVEQYQSLLNRLTETNDEKIAFGNIIGLSEAEGEKLINSLSAEELSVMAQIIPDFESSRPKIEDELNKYSSGGNVNLTLRPEIDTSVLKDAGWEEAAGDVATVFTSTFSNEAGNIAMNFTPIMADENGNHIGTLSPDDLQKYAEEVIAGTREDDLKLQIGAKFEGDDAIQKAEQAAQEIHKLQESYYGDPSKELRAAIDREMTIQGLIFDLNLEIEAAGIESLNTALSESVTASGLSSESISALKSRYSDLEGQGYDLSSMFEETSHGIHLNRNELSKFENELSKQKIDEIDGDLKKMKATYDDLGEAIKNCEDPVEKSKLFDERQSLAQKISEAATLASQYKGLTSAYNDWIAAEESGNERDMYENVISGFETVKDELSRGWADDSTVEFLEMLTGKTDLASKSGAELKEIYDSLDNTIKNTSYSVKDFFTVDKDGNSTSKGVYNFLDAVGQLQEKVFGRKDIITRDSKGNVIGFDFEVAGGDEAISEALGISEELVQIMVRAADDAGFVVSMDGTYKQLADLQNEARDAANYLKGIGKTDFNFDFNTSSISSLTAQLEEAHKILDNEEYWNADGTFNFDADGATQAMTIVSTLQAKLDTLTQENYGIGLTVEDKQFEEPLENLQNYGRTVATLNQLELNPKANAEDIIKLKDDLDNIAKYFAELDKDTKVNLGFDADDGIAEVKSKIENGEVKIPTTLDIQTNMDKNIEKLADLAWLQSGFLSDSEEKTIRVKYGIDFEAGDVDTTDVDEAISELAGGSGFHMDSDGTVRHGGRGGKFEVNADAELKINNVDVPDSSESIDTSNFTMDSDGTVRHGGRGGKFEVETDAELELGKIDTSDFDKDIDKATDGKKGKETTRTQNIEIIAETFGIEDIDALAVDLESLDDKTVQAIAKVLGQVDVNKLNTAILSLDDKTVQAIAQTLGQGDVEALKLTINGIENEKTIQIIAEAFGYENIDELNESIDNIDPETVRVVAKAIGARDVNNLRAAINGVQGKSVTVSAYASGMNSVLNLKKVIDSLKDKTVKVTAEVDGNLFGGSGADGTANVNGTAFANGAVGDSGVAFKRGDWGVKKTQVALTGELGPELVVYGNRWYTVGDSGAEFAKIPKGAIIFNHKQTEELFKNGKVTSYGGRGKALANGTAFAEGTAFSSGSGGGFWNTSGSNTATSNSSTGSSYKPSSSDSSSANEFEETIDWIEVAIDRIERAIDKLDTKVNSIYRSWSERNTSLVSEISKVREEIDLQQQAYNEYIKAAEATDLSSEWVEKVRNGTIDIETIKDETLKKRIDDYRKYYEAALDAEKAVVDLKEKESELYKQRFDIVSTRYDGYISAIEHEKSMLEEYMNQSEAQAWLVSRNYYDALINNQLENIAELENKKAEMVVAFNEAMDSGTIVEGSEAWNEMVLSIDEVALAIQESKTQILEYDQAIQQLEFDIFDLLQDKISGVTEETEFLIDLLSNKKLYDDNGKLTSDGSATIGLHGVAYNTYMHQADLAAKEVEKLKKELAEDPFDTELEERYREMIGLQQEHILAAEKEKDAIKDLVEEGIELELDALNERIDKYKESVDSAKSLYEYNKKVKEQTEEIASLEKQMAAYSGDDSEEARQKVQKIKVDLEEARANLEETEYDKWVEDSGKMLDDLYLEYETILNTRLDNVDALISDMIAEINNDAVIIGDTIREAANSVGYTLTDSMKSIWDENAVSTKNVITTYGDKFANAQTTTNNTLTAINTKLQNMISQLNKKAATNTTTASQSSVTKPPSSTNNTNKPSGDGTPKVGDRVKFISGQYYYDSYGQKPLGSHNQDEYVYITNINKNGSHPYHISTGSKLGKGDLGWLKLNQISGYASGKKNFFNDEIAWTQEDGMEYIVRPSDGAILTPVAKRDSILNHAASNNIWDMANNPAKFIKNNLNLGSTNVPNNSNVNNSIIQNFENITFSMPNVRGYNDLLREMQSDPKFEKLVLSMTLDQIAGRSKLVKGKSIR